MSIPSLYVIILKMTLVSNTVTSVKKNEIPSNGSITVKIAVILLISNILLGKTQITRNTNNGHLFRDLHINLIVKTISMTQMIYQSLQYNFNIHDNFNFYLYIFHLGWTLVLCCWILCVIMTVYLHSLGELLFVPFEMKLIRIVILYLSKHLTCCDIN